MKAVFLDHFAFFSFIAEAMTTQYMETYLEPRNFVSGDTAIPGNLTYYSILKKGDVRSTLFNSPKWMVGIFLVHMTMFEIYICHVRNVSGIF